MAMLQDEIKKKEVEKRMVHFQRDIDAKNMQQELEKHKSQEMIEQEKIQAKRSKL